MKRGAARERITFANLQYTYSMLKSGFSYWNVELQYSEQNSVWTSRLAKYDGYSMSMAVVFNFANWKLVSLT